jgi:Xaa-Pro aminopeptidase
VSDVPSLEEWRRELETRRAAAQEIVARHGADGLVVFGTEGHAEPFRYLTNFQPMLGSMWMVIPAEGTACCAVDFQWQLEEARRRSGIAEWSGAPPPIRAVVDVIRDRGLGRLLVAGRERMSVVDWEHLASAFPKAGFEDVGAELAEPRRRKTEIELRCLRRAARATDEAFEVVRSEIRPGMTELEIAARLGYVLRRGTGEWAFTPCVISGNDDPIPIREPTARKIEAGDSVMIDIGGACDGYQADASRTWVLGSPSPLQERVWEAITAGYAASMSAVRPGTPCRVVAEEAIGVLTAAGFGLGHRVGHGIGLATSFEWPSLDHEDSALEPGMTFCLEPGVYTPGAGNMKLEDDVLVTEDGVESLTHTSRELVVA